jgi:hypothetical protein
MQFELVQKTLNIIPIPYVIRYDKNFIRWHVV